MGSRAAARGAPAGRASPVRALLRGAEGQGLQQQLQLMRVGRGGWGAGSGQRDGAERRRRGRPPVQRGGAASGVQPVGARGVHHGEVRSRRRGGAVGARVQHDEARPRRRGGAVATQLLLWRVVVLLQRVAVGGVAVRLQRLLLRLQVVGAHAGQPPQRGLLRLLWRLLLRLLQRHRRTVGLPQPVGRRVRNLRSGAQSCISMAASPFSCGAALAHVGGLQRCRKCSEWYCTLVVWLAPKMTFLGQIDTGQLPGLW